MFLTSWFPVSQLRRVLRRQDRSRHQPRREPTRSRLTLESLEERSLLDASASFVVAPTIPAVNTAPLTNGFVIQTVSNFPNTTGVTFHAFPSGWGEASLAVTSAFLSQDQLNSQFRAFGVNSQAAISQQYQMTADILFAAYGFGSGVTPNAPWMPAAYNLGLANHQYNYPSQSDLGY